MRLQSNAGQAPRNLRNVRDMKTARLTMSQALVRWMCAQSVEQSDGAVEPAFAGVWAIFGHGNVAGLGEALWEVKKQLPTYRGHNEQGMAHAAIAYAKQKQRRRMMAVTTSIGPGATNLVTAAALAHVNRLPVLLLPGDVFANRRPDPVLQQVESFADALVSANDCLRPVSRYFDRITRPEQLLQSLPRAMSVLCDAAECGPATLCLCQDVQAEAFDWPVSFFEARTWKMRRVRPDEAELAEALARLGGAKRPLIIAGGGVRYSGASESLERLAAQAGIPVAATQAGKSAMVESHPMYVGALGVTGSSAANEIAGRADVVLSVGSRLQDFTTGSNGLIQGQVIALNVQQHDLVKHRAMPLMADARAGLDALRDGLAKPGTASQGAAKGYGAEIARLKNRWLKSVDAATKAPSRANQLASDAQVIGAVMRGAPDNAIVVGAAGSMPGELHKLWQTKAVDGYHMEYGFSCMGYEVAAGIGVHMAAPERPNVVFAGDGSYLMLNAELATAVMMGVSMTLVITDNRGFGCINRLQAATGGAAFNNMLQDSHHEVLPEIDFVAHAASMGASARKADSPGELETMVREAMGRAGVDVIVIDTDPGPSTGDGGTWWDVAVPEVSKRQAVNKARATYVKMRKRQDR